MVYQFNPLLKQTLWGGDRIANFKRMDTNAATPGTNIGESWEISGVKGSETVVAAGPDRGKTLNQLVSEQREWLVGQENYQRYGNEFPLLVKFIDAHQDLSIQVHPDDATARRHGRERGKTEMWYVLDSQPGARLYNGLRRSINATDYQRMVEDDTITDALACYEVHQGDVFFIPAGRIHAIGAGCFVTEIQQTCDVTYRIYDYKRKDKDGNYRELHTQLAAESIDYTLHDDYRTHYEPRKNSHVSLVACPYFTTALYDLDEPMTIDYADLDSFVILVAVGGEGTLEADGEQVPFRCGDTMLLPATTQQVLLTGDVKFLETY